MIRWLTEAATALERRIGWAGIAALPMCLVLTGALWLWSETSRELAAERVVTVRREALASKASQDARARQAAARRPPLEGAFPDDLRRLYTAAALKGLQVVRAEYRTRRDVKKSTVSVEVSMPLEADYASLKAFVSEALTSLPNLALEEFRVQRHDVSDGIVQAQLVLTLSYRKGDR